MPDRPAHRLRVVGSAGWALALFAEIGKAGVRLAVPRRTRWLLRYRVLALLAPFVGLDGIDRLIERKCTDILNANAYYVEAGANDGLTLSNTYFLERKYRARGLLVEPAPPRFLELVRNRSPRNDFACCALVPFGYADRFVPMVYADLMSVADINGDTDLPAGPAAHLEAARPHMRDGERVFEFAARARTLTEILDEAGAPHEIDLLSLDVEGNELNVLRGVDFERYRFHHMLIECRDIERMIAFLDVHGYGLREQLSSHDYLFSPHTA